MGKLIDEIKSRKTGALYTIRDANTYRSLSDAQAITLLDRAIYNGELVTSGEIFTCADGTMKQFTYDTVMGGDETFVPADVGATNPTGLFGIFKDTIFVRSDGVKKSSNKGASFTSTPLSDYYTSFLKTDDFALIFYAGYDLASTTFLKTTDGTNFTQVTPVVDGSYSTSEYKGFLSSSSYAYLVDTSSNQTDNKYAWTSDGVNWKVATYPEPSNPAAQNVYNKAVYIFKDKLHVAYSTVFGTGGLFRLDDVENGTWTELTPSTAIYSNSVTAAGNYLYIIDNGTATYYSTDGYTFNSTSDWSEKPQGTVFYCKDTGVYVSVYRYGYDVTYKTSTNGTTWSSSSSAPGANNNPQGDAGTDFVFLYCDMAGTKRFFRIDTGVSIVDKTLTALSYNKTQVDNLITGGTTLDDIATAGDGIKFVETATQNFNVVGSLTINDGVASGFTNQTNYIATTYLFEPNNDTWEVYYKVKTSNDVNTMQFFHGVCNNHDYQCPLIGVWNGRFIISLSSNASSWDIASASSGSHSVQANTDYLVKLVFDGSSYKLYYKRGSDNDFVADITISSSTKCVNCTTAYLGIGVNHYDSTSSGMEWLGSIDLNECYVKIDDTITWQPYTQTSSKPAITADIGSGASAPTSSTEGYVGKLYITTGGAVYICTGVSGSTYTWKQISTGVPLSGGSNN